MKPFDTLSDLATLAKAGFTASEIKEIISTKEIPEEPAPKVEETVPKEETQPEPKAEESVDYKLAYEDAMAELTTLKKDLESAQKHNAEKPVNQESLSDQQKVNDMFLNLL